MQGCVGRSLNKLLLFRRVILQLSLIALPLRKVQLVECLNVGTEEELLVSSKLIRLPLKSIFTGGSRGFGPRGVKSFVGKCVGCCLHDRETLRPSASLRRLRDMPNPPCHSSRPQTVRLSPLASDRIALWPDTCQPSWARYLSLACPSNRRISPHYSWFLENV